MSEEINQDNWKIYQKGLRPLNIAGLINDLVSDDYLVRQRSYSNLSEQIENAYKIGNDLPNAIVPFLVNLLNNPQLPYKGLLTDLLIYMVSFADEAQQEPYKTYASKI